MDVNLNLPRYLQPIGSGLCVPYAIMSILELYDISRTMPEIIKGCKTHYKQGTDQDDYTKYLQSLGLKFVRIKFKHNEIARALADETAIAICYANHFSIISGCHHRHGVPFYTLTDPFYGIMDIPHDILEEIMQAEGKEYNGLWCRKIVVDKRA